MSALRAVNLNIYIVSFECREKMVFRDILAIINVPFTLQDIKKDNVNFALLKNDENKQIQSETCCIAKRRGPAAQPKMEVKLQRRLNNSQKVLLI